MEELLAKMASLLQEIYDEGHGGEFRGSINLLLVQYNAAQQSVQRTGFGCPHCMMDAVIDENGNCSLCGEPRR